MSEDGRRIRTEEEKAGKLREKVKEKVKEVKVRMHISVPKHMKDELKKWADDLDISVSNLIRNALGFVKNNLGDLTKLEAWDRKMEKGGNKIEKSVKKSGLEDLGDEIEHEIVKGKTEPKKKVGFSQKIDIERIKKRIRGLIKIQKSLPIDKFAKALNRTNNYTENLIYELADEGIEGSIEDGIFKFTNDPEEVISKLLNMIDNVYESISTNLS